MSTPSDVPASRMREANARIRSSSGLLWLAIPFAIYVLTLRRLWFNAPVWDDYDCVLRDTFALLDASSLREWASTITMLHNEHRIAIVRLVAWLQATVLGHLDFRLMVAAGVASVFAMAVLVWYEFRRQVAPALFAAASLLLFQWSYYEGTIMGSAALANLTVVTFSFATLFFSTRDGAAAVAVTVVLGILAAGALASGLFALPIAAAGAVFLRERGRALIYGAVAIALWGLYFGAYHAPPGHPSVAVAFVHPVSAAWLFVLIVGSIMPGIWIPTLAGAAMLVALAWLVRKRFWTRHPTAALWVLFILVSIAATTVGRAGFGVIYTSRYALYSSALAMVMFLAASEMAVRWTFPRIVAAIAAAALVSAGATAASWLPVKRYSVTGQRLAKAIPATPAVPTQGYFGMFYPVVTQSQAHLEAAEKRGLYTPRVARIFPTALRNVATLPADARLGGHLDRVVVNGNRVYAGGWTDIPAVVPNRTFLVFPAEGDPKPGPIFTDDRADAAMVNLSPDLEFGGFHFELEYPSEEAARRAAPHLCLAVQAPNAGTAVLPREDAPCGPGQAPSAR